MLGSKEYRLLGLLLLLFVASQKVSCEWHDDYGPWVIATKGEPWPLTQTRDLYDAYYNLDSASFDIQVVQENCDIVEEAVKRYKSIILKEHRVAEKLAGHTSIPKVQPLNENETIVYKGYLTALQIRLTNRCENFPLLYSNESYHLHVPSKISSDSVALLSSESVWGILRGLETFSQLLIARDSKLVVKSQNIYDAPRLPHRGLLLDTSRHYLPVDDILLTLDAMSYNKLNVLHWHIVDDNSFPYESALFPELSAKGAYHPLLVYTIADVQKIIEHARLRGIRVLPEFDTPGHTKSWGQSHPEFLTTCYDENGKPNGRLGPMNPISQPLYVFLKDFLREANERFPDKYIHLGGDEVLFDCWKSNPAITSYMHKNNFSQKYEKLEEVYIQRVLDMVFDLEIKPIVWQEVFDNGVKMHEGTVVHVWTGNWRTEMAAVTAAGHPVLLSACWYLDHILGGGDWIKYYNCDPLDFRKLHTSVVRDQKSLVLGGEACMWGEFVDRNNVHQRIWPRASAVAERLWSVDREDEAIAAKRLEEHACRMNRRGIPAQPPNGSGFCIT